MPASKQSTNLYFIYLTPYVQSWTPDDGRKDRPKHVEWHLINSKIVHLVSFTIEISDDARSQERQISKANIRPLRISQVCYHRFGVNFCLHTQDNLQCQEPHDTKNIHYLLDVIVCSSKRYYVLYYTTGEALKTNRSTGCPTRYWIRHFFNNSNTNEDTATKQTHTTDTFLFISHTKNVLLLKFRCSIFIGVRITKEMPGSVTSGTPCTICKCNYLQQEIKTTDWIID